MACDVSEMKPFQNLHFLFLFLLSAVADPKTTTKPITVKKNPPLKFGVNKNRRKQILRYKPGKNLQVSYLFKQFAGHYYTLFLRLV